MFAPMMPPFANVPRFENVPLAPEMMLLLFAVYVKPLSLTNVELGPMVRKLASDPL